MHSKHFTVEEILTGRIQLAHIFRRHKQLLLSAHVFHVYKQQSISGLWSFDLC